MRGPEVKGILRVNGDGGAGDTDRAGRGRGARVPVLNCSRRRHAAILQSRKATAQDRWENAQIVAQSVTSRKRTIIVSPGSDARYLSTGHVVYTLAGSIHCGAIRPSNAEAEESSRASPRGRQTIARRDHRRRPVHRVRHGIVGLHPGSGHIRAGSAHGGHRREDQRNHATRPSSRSVHASACVQRRDSHGVQP